MLFQYVKMTKSIIHAISHKPDDQAEWRNILQLMYHLRQALACSMCGKLVPDPYTPVQEPCHCICASCRDGPAQMRYNCITCRQAFEAGSEDGFEINSNLNYTAVGFVKLCKLLVAKDIVHKWSNLQVATTNGPITFGQLIQEGYNSDGFVNNQNLGDKFRKRVKEKEHHCRCGSGAKRNEGRAPGNLTCLGQRCACYRKGKGCVSCKCVGCKNPNGTSTNRFRDADYSPNSLTGTNSTRILSDDSPLPVKSSDGIYGSP